MRSIGFITKKAHKKSRFGCIECKRRKQKCDEVQPECGSCKKRKVTCQYISRVTTHTVRRAATHAPVTEEKESFNNTTTASAESTSSDSSQDEFSNLDTPITQSTSLPTSPTEEKTQAGLSIVLRKDPLPLSISRSIVVVPWQNDFEHQLYVTVVDKHRQSMVKPGLDNATREIWLEVVPKTAFNTERTLFQLMLSLGSLHTAIDSSDYPCLRPGTQAARLWKLSTSYFGQAVSSFRKSLQSGQMFDTNPEVLYVTALVLSYRTSLYANHLHTDVESLYEDTLGWYTAALGYIALGGFFTSKLRNTQLGHILKANPETTYNLFPFMDYIASQELPYFDYLHPQTTFSYDLTGDPDPEDVTKEALHAYTISIKMIGWVWQAVLTEKLNSEIYSMYHIVPYAVPKHFLTLLRERRPRAIAILAHHIATLASLGVHEGLHSWPKEHILLLKELIPSNWTWALNRALNVVKQGEEWHSNSTRSRVPAGRMSFVESISAG